MRAAIYARVSTRDKGQDPENQLAELRTYCQRQGWTLVEVYVDRDTAKHGNREAFKRLFEAASRRLFDVVLVWALDRFTREGIWETFDYIRKLTAAGVQFESYTEAHFRTTGPAGEVMLAIAAWIAKQERLRISERTKAGLARVKREGKTLGRPRRVFDRNKIRKLKAAGLSLRQIAAKTGIPRSTVAEALKAA
jgi:DNA invertase Pin-like site-specific DNA recombinase